jgi:hypothetical protein
VDDRRQLREVRLGRMLATFDTVERLGEFSQALQALRIGGVTLVGNVVGSAREAIDRLDRSAQAFGSRSEATGKFS